MKRFTYAMVMAVALILMVSSFAFAGGEECAKKADAKTAKAECTTAEKAACATGAKAECKTPCADHAIYKAASADMKECCAAAVAKGEGCCGQEADALKAGFEQKVAYHKVAAEVKAEMHKCCAASMAEGKGCCGHSAEEMKADFDKKVEAKAKKVASQETASDDS
jgi:hypothetical protein